MYLIQRGPNREPQVVPVWGTRGKTGVVTYCDPAIEGRLWAEPLEAFETELRAWQEVEKILRESMAEARALVARGEIFLPDVKAKIFRLQAKARRTA